jgi:hypothetical protein
MDPALDSEFLWIAEESLIAPLPPNWEQLADEEDTPYYYNSVSGESVQYVQLFLATGLANCHTPFYRYFSLIQVWEHPKDQSYVEMFQQLKAQKTPDQQQQQTQQGRADARSTSHIVMADGGKTLDDELPIPRLFMRPSVRGRQL